MTGAADGGVSVDHGAAQGATAERTAFYQIATDGEESERDHDRGDYSDKKIIRHYFLPTWRNIGIQ